MGRTSLILVMGFNIIFATMGYNLSHVATGAYENYVGYYSNTVAHEFAASAANIAASQIAFSPTSTPVLPSYTNVPFQGGVYSIQTTYDLVNDQVRILATATFGSITSQSVLLLGRTNFARFGYYSNQEGGIYWMTGDSVWGPFHTQQSLNVSGTPYFGGRVSTRNGITRSPKSSRPIFVGGYQTGVNIPFPGDLGLIKQFAQTEGAYFNNQDVYMAFNADSTVTYRLGSWTAPTSYNVKLSVLAPNGVIVADNANMHIKGILSGRVTISALGSSGASKGNVWIDSSIVYNKNPQTDPTSGDMLGIVTDNNVIVADNANNDNPAKGVNINASIMALSGGLTAENPNSRPVSGTLTLIGGIQQNQRGAVGQFNTQTQTILNGFQKNYRYDARLETGFPPRYPSTGMFEVLTWFE